jgi:oligopeptidase B
VRVRKHVLGTPVADDVLVYEEQDDSFYMGIGRTRDDKLHHHRRAQHRVREERYAPAADPREFVVLARARDVEYDADHFGGRWVIRTNDGAKNFKLVTAPTDASSRAQWKDWIAHDDAVFIDGFELFDATPPSPNVPRAGTHPLLFKDGRSDYVKADEPAYSMGLGDNTEPIRLAALRLHLDDHPDHHLRAEHRTGERRQLKVQPVIGYDPSKYETERVWSPRAMA